MIEIVEVLPVFIEETALTAIEIVEVRPVFIEEPTATVTEATEKQIVFVGEQGPPGATPEHEWQGTSVRFKKPDGTWGDAVPLGITNAVIDSYMAARGLI